MLMEAIKVEGVYEYPSIALDLQCREKAEFDALVNGVNTETGGQDYSKKAAPDINEGTSLSPNLPWAVPAPIEPWDVDYPLEAAMQDDLIKMVLGKLSVRFQVAEDKTNNANDDAGAKQAKR